jgi:microcompartment protein CcmK/EutM
MREQILANAVINNITVSGKFNSNTHNVCDLMNLSIESIDSLYRTNKELLDKHSTQSLLKKEKGTKLLEDKLLLLQTIFELKVEQEAAIKLAAANRAAKQNKLILLSKAKEAKEIQAINELSLDELEKQIAELS